MQYFSSLHKGELVSECRDSCDGTSQDQRVYVVRTLIGINRLQVHNMPDHMIFIAYAISTQHVPHLARNI